MDEGVAQLFTSNLNGRKIIGTVGALQFEVIQYRLEHEYGAACRWEPISIHKACWIRSDNTEQLADFKRRKHTNMAVDKHGRDVFWPIRAMRWRWPRRISRISASTSPRSSDAARLQTAACAAGGCFMLPGLARSR